MKGKELDPRHFNAEEQKAFDEADKKNWVYHIKLGAVRVIPPEQATGIPRDRVLPLPARFVRTNKSKGPNQLEARSRLVIRPHGDPDADRPLADGGFRVDAPVAHRWPCTCSWRSRRPCAGS